jgi:hypothetical protein
MTLQQVNGFNLASLLDIQLTTLLLLAVAEVVGRLRVLETLVAVALVG